MFIEIAPDEFINTDRIEHVKAVDSMTCLAATGSNLYTVQMPAKTLVGMVGAGAKERSNEIEVLKQINHKVGELPIFAG